jgi:hypothetical protein
LPDFIVLSNPAIVCREEEGKLDDWMIEQNSVHCKGKENSEVGLEYTAFCSGVNSGTEMTTFGASEIWNKIDIDHC